MKFGAFLWQRRGEDLAANARLAEELGFESVWMGEHLAHQARDRRNHLGLTRRIQAKDRE
jgi:alkanesulfonate monooxygenase SsuD/methylene tetrahydromethanopterin reductase-like flavin-dependent oxidoreductase (luciferase family)